MSIQQFLPRTSYPQLDSLVRSYFLGHHRSGLTKMSQMVSSVELIIECRDYRVPLSSRNPMFEQALTGRERLMVYTKRDLADEGALDKMAMETIRNWHKPNKVLFSDVRDKTDIKKIIDYARETAIRADSLIGCRMLIVGMPNVGKSSLLNALRNVGTGRGKAALTGGQPGVTRKLSTSVKISEKPLIYLIDSPGVFVPYARSSESMLKLSLVGCVKDTIVPPVTLADYLLYQLNLHDPSLYSQYHPPTNNALDFLAAVAHKTGRLMKGGEPDLEAAALWIVGRWRSGVLGRFMLDAVDEGALARWTEEDGAEQSANQLKKRAKEEREKTRKAKNAAMVSKRNCE